MAKTLVEKDLKHIIYGATLLGAGGGGSMKDGLRLLSDAASRRDVELNMVAPEEMGPGDCAVMVAGIGAPRAMEETHFGPEAVDAYEMMKRVAFLGGKNLKYVMAGELGGFNTMVPMYVAMVNDVPFVDGDGNGRAVPELATGLYPIFDIPPTPLVMAGRNGDVMVAYINDPRDHHSAENIARHISVAYGMSAAFCTWVVDGRDIIDKLAPGSIERCRAIGSAIAGAKEANLDAAEAVKAVVECEEVFRGTIERVEVKTEAGFDFGTTTILGTGEYAGQVRSIDFKNENLLMKNGDGEVVLTVPDLICLLDLDKREPLTNAETAGGQNISVLGVPAPANWWKKQDGFSCWKHILEKIGYTGECIRVA